MPRDASPNDGLSQSQFDLTDGHVARWADWTVIKLATGKLLKSPRPPKTRDFKQDGDRILVDLESRPVWAAPQSPPPVGERADRKRIDMWRQFRILGGGLLVVSGLLFLAGLGGQEVTQLQPGLSLLGVLLAGIGGMLFHAGLIGAAVGADWRSIQKGEKSLESGRETGPLVCDQCGEIDNRVRSTYCRTCGAEEISSWLVATGVQSRLDAGAART